MLCIVADFKKKKFFFLTFQMETFKKFTFGKILWHLNIATENVTDNNNNQKRDTNIITVARTYTYITDFFFSCVSRTVDTMVCDFDELCLRSYKFITSL